MDAQQKTLKARLKKARDNSFSYVPENWTTKLWNMSSTEINEYILCRFEDTNDEMEYYTCLVYLYNTTTKFNKLLIEWKDSTNYQRFLKLLQEEDKKMCITKPDTTKKVNKKRKVADKAKPIRKTEVKPKKILRTAPITNNFI